MFKNRKLAILILLFGISNFVLSQTNEEIDLAKQAIFNLSIKDYNKACFSFDEGLKSIMPDSITQKMWEGIVKKCGKYEKDLKIKTKKLVNQNSISITSKFEKSEVISTFVTYLDSAKGYKIGAVYFLPKTKDNSYLLPTYINKKLFKTEKLGFKELENQKENILYNYTEDIESSPLAIFVSDIYKDEYNSENEFQPFRDITWGISSKGLSTIQINMISKENLLNSDYLSDKLNYVFNQLKNKINIDTNNIFIISDGFTPKLLSKAKLKFEVKSYICLNSVFELNDLENFKNKLSDEEKKIINEYDTESFIKFLESYNSKIYFYDTESDTSIFNKKYNDLKVKLNSKSNIIFKQITNHNKYFCKLEQEKKNENQQFEKFTDIDIVNDIFNVIFEFK